MTTDPMMTGSYASWNQERAATPRNPTDDLSLRLDQAWGILNLNQDLIRSERMVEPGGLADQGQLVHRSRPEHGAGPGLGRLPWR